jgi:hypothetical protein
MSVLVVLLLEIHHFEFDIEHQGLDSDLPCVAKLQMGEIINNEWVIKELYLTN